MKMKRKHLVYLLMSSFAAANGFAETLADPDEIQPVKTFSSQTDCSDRSTRLFPRNQFDRNRPQQSLLCYRNIDQAFRPLKANSGF